MYWEEKKNEKETLQNCNITIKQKKILYLVPILLLAPEILMHDLFFKISYHIFSQKIILPHHKSSSHRKKKKKLEPKKRPKKNLVHASHEFLSRARVASASGRRVQPAQAKNTNDGRKEATRTRARRQTCITIYVYVGASIIVDSADASGRRAHTARAFYTVVCLNLGERHAGLRRPTSTLFLRRAAGKGERKARP